MDHNYLYRRGIEQNDRILILGATGGDFIKTYYREILEKNAFVINVEPTFEGVFELSNFCRKILPFNSAILSVAVSDYTGFSTMDIRENLITSTLEERPETNQRWYMPLLYQQRVPVVTFDFLLQVCSPVTKVFADVEGSELEIFGSSKYLGEVDYYAIAAYHLRDGEITANKLKEIFSGFNQTITGEASRINSEVVFFAERKE